jgi:hypothetical protein
MKIIADLPVFIPFTVFFEGLNKYLSFGGVFPFHLTLFRPHGSGSAF